MPAVKSSSFKASFKANAKKGYFIEQDLNNKYQPKTDESGEVIQYQAIQNYLRDIKHYEGEHEGETIHSLKFFMGEFSNEEVLECTLNGFTLSLLNTLSGKENLSSKPLEIRIYKGKDKATGKPYRGSNCYVEFGGEKLGWEYEYKDVSSILDKDEAAITRLKGMIEAINNNLNPLSGGGSSSEIETSAPPAEDFPSSPTTSETAKEETKVATSKDLPF
jgi:hypothetical protein